MLGFLGASVSIHNESSNVPGFLNSIFIRLSRMILLKITTLCEDAIITVSCSFL